MASKFPMKPVFVMCFFPKQNLIKVHLILSLHGGGKATKAEDLTKAKNSLAAFLLDTGADLADVKTFTEKGHECSGICCCSTYRPYQKSGCKNGCVGKISTSLSIPLPAMSKAATQRKNLVKKKLHDGKLDNLTLMRVISSCNRDSSEIRMVLNASKLIVFRQAKSGIMLMNPKEAFHWLQMNKMNIASPRMSLVC